MSQGTGFAIQSIATVVLARLLTPADFGLVAMVTAITGLGQAFADLGLSEATIQSEVVTQTQVSTLFWVNVGIGFVLMLLTAGSAPALAWFLRRAAAQKCGAGLVGDVPDRRPQSAARRTFEAPDAFLFTGGPGHRFLCRGCPYRDRGGLARGRAIRVLVILPLTLNTTQMALVLGDGRMDPQPAAAGRESEIAHPVWGRYSRFLLDIQHQPQCENALNRVSALGAAVHWDCIREHTIF